MTIYELIKANAATLRALHRNGVSPSYLHLLPIYDDYTRLVGEGKKVRWVARHVGEKFGYSERYVRLVVKMMNEKATL